MLNETSTCHNAFFGSPNPVIVVTMDGRHGKPMLTARSYPSFQSRYLEKLQALERVDTDTGTELSFHDYIPFAVEMPTIFTRLVNAFLL
jgi:hypothetical protein